MKVIDNGHKYIVSHLDGNSEQQITFVKREGENYPGNVGTYEGTTCQEILRTLINRCQYLYNQKKCVETFIIIKFLIFALFLFEFRHARIQKRLILPVKILEQKTCYKCGHIHCKEH